MLGADLRAIDVFARPRTHRSGVECAQQRIGLCSGIIVRHLRRDQTPQSGATSAFADLATRNCGSLCRPCAPLRRRRGGIINVSDALDVGATGALQLSLYPIEGGAVAIRALLPIAELCQAFDRRFVPL